MNRIGRFVALAVFGLGVAGAAQAQSVSPSFAASRASCVAPCFVHFDATNTDSDGDGTRGEWFDDLVDANFGWDFGDSTAAGKTWAYGARATTAVGAYSKNRDVGFVAGHLFEQPGTYTVKLTVTNKNGNAASTTATIQVAAWSNATNGPTYCFSTSGNFSGCPSGSTQVTSSDFDASVAACTNNNARAARCLFRGGETFAQSADINGLRPGPGILAGGAFYGFGTGRANLTPSYTPFSPRTDWRFFGFKVAAGANQLMASTRTETHVLVWDNEITGWRTLAIGELGNNAGIIENYMHDGATGVVSCATGYWGKSALLGNRCINASPTTTTHAFRAEWWRLSTFAHNQVANWGASGDGIKANSHCNDSNCSGPFNYANLDELVLIYDNDFGIGQLNEEGISIGAQNGTSNEPVARFLVDSNWMHAYNGYAGASGGLVHFKSCDSCVARNNVIQPAGIDQAGIRVEDVPVVEIRDTNNRVVGNSFWDSSTGCNSSNVPFRVQGSNVVGAVFQNNLAYTGSCAKSAVSCSGSTPSTCDHNLRATSKPFVGAAPTTMDALELATSASSVIDQGVHTTGAVVDAFGGLRANLTPDIGAHELGAPRVDAPVVVGPPPPPVLLSSQ